MKVTTFEGIIEDGQIRLAADVNLPEHARVFVVVPDAETREAAAYIRSPRLAHPEQAKNFEKVAVGDVVEATYTGSVVFRIMPKGKTQSGAPQRVDPTAAGANVGQKVTSSFEVASVDPTANILWVTLPNGTTKPINFDEKSQVRLMTLSPGDVVSATYTESAAIQLEKLAR